VKVTTKAMLINVSEENIKTIDNLMVVFCSAIRFSFNRIIEDKRIGDIEKDISKKYGLNIRQSKDAVENARQIIASQKKLLKMNYENYLKKVKVIEKLLNNDKKKLSYKNRCGLVKKLEKRQRKLSYYKGFMDKNTVPPVIFGTKEMFIKRCKGLISKEQWQEYRASRVYSRGDKTKNGNPNLRIISKDNKTFLEISTLDKTKTNRAIKIQVEVYLPQKLSRATGKINGRNYKQMFLDYLQTDEAYQVELIRKNQRYYCHITFEEDIVVNPEVLNTGHYGMIGIDTNPDGLALTMIDSNGNYKWHTYIKNGELAGACNHSGVEITKVKPQFTSKIGLYKYCHQYEMGVHNGAAMVIARRSYSLKEKVPKDLKERIIEDLDKFNNKNEWSKWSEINKNIKRKVGEKPALWLNNRKKYLEELSL